MTAKAIRGFHRPKTRIAETANDVLQADYGISYARNLLEEPQPGRNLNYWALWTGYKF